MINGHGWSYDTVCLIANFTQYRWSGDEANETSLCEICCVVELCVFVYSLITMCPVMYGRCGCVLFVCDIGGTHNDVH